MLMRSRHIPTTASATGTTIGVRGPPGSGRPPVADVEQRAAGRKQVQLRLVDPELVRPALGQAVWRGLADAAEWHGLLPPGAFVRAAGDRVQLLVRTLGDADS